MCGKLSSISRLMAMVRRSSRPLGFGDVLEVAQDGVVGMERQRDEGLEAARLVLQLAQPAQVVDAMLGVFDVAVEHGGVGAQAEFVGLAVDAQPGVGVGLVLADLVADLGMEDLRPAAGQAAQARLLELGQQVARRPAGQPGEPVPFDARCTPSGAAADGPGG